MLKIVEKNIIIICGLLILVSIIFAFTNAKIGYDTGLYHLMKVQWLVEYGHVPGLANLDGRLGFYSIYFYLACIIVEITSQINAVFYINLAVVIGFLFYVIKYLLNNNTFSIKIFLIISFAYLCIYFNLIKSLYQDIGAYVLFSLMFAHYLKIIIEKSEISPFKVLFSIALLVSIKFSYIFLIVLIPLFIYDYKNYKIEINDYIFSLIVILLIALLIFHNYVTSGWLLYPSTIINIFSPDWKVPYYLANNNDLVTRLFARNPSDIENLLLIKNQPFLEWIAIWWKAKESFWWLLNITLLSLILIPFLIEKNRACYHILKLWFVSVFTLILWLLTAPSIRFGLQWLLFPFGLLIFSFQKKYFSKNTKKRSLLFRSELLKSIIVLVSIISITILFVRESSLYTALRYNYPTLKFSFTISLPEVEYVKYSRKDSDDEWIYVPKDGERSYYPTVIPVASRLFQDRKFPFINDIPRYRGKLLKDGFYTDTLNSIQKEEFTINDYYTVQ